MLKKTQQIETRKNKKTAQKKMNTAADPSPDKRYEMISETAYYIAEQRGFSGGDPLQDWLEAERQVDGIEGRQD